MAKAILIILSLAGFASGAEMEVTDRLSVDGSSLFKSTAVFSGSVGIGTTQPASKLEVVGGEIKISSSSAACTGVNAGAIRWDGTHFLGCNGSTWRQLDNPPPPTVSSISPSSGIVSGGTILTISGSGFNLGLVVLIGGVETTVTGVRDTQITATTPAGSAGTKEVRITNPDGQFCISAFIYNPLPTITTVSPNSGHMSTDITITGTGFATGVGVTIGNVAATNVTRVSDTQITATTPASPAGGTQDVKITNPDTGSAVLAGGFTYRVSATGGDTVVDSGGYRIHTFTTVGTSALTFTSPGNVEVLVVAGGGGGGWNSNSGGGGGGGGLVYNAAYPASGSITVTVGAGGSSSLGSRGGTGGNSVFGSITASGGGGGGSQLVNANGLSGGSGGGGCYDGGSGGSETSGQGNRGGNVTSNSNNASGAGGGGAGAAGQDTDQSSLLVGKGGDGLAYSISGLSTYYAGGGAGGRCCGTGYGNGGLGGGGGTSQQNGSANTGGGGRGSWNDGSGGSGGSGIVIVRYPL